MKVEHELSTYQEADLQGLTVSELLQLQSAVTAFEKANLTSDPDITAMAKEIVARRSMVQKATLLLIRTRSAVRAYIRKLVYC